MAIPGTIPVTGIIAPTTTGDTYPVYNPIYGLGGLRTVPNSVELSAITTQRREVGMIVYVSGTSEYYKLESGLTNSDWVLLNIGSGTSLNGYFLSLSGGTVTGDTYFTQGLSASTFSAGTLYSGSTNLYDIFLPIGFSASTGNFIPMTGTGANLVTGDIQIDDAVNLSWNAGNETLQYNPGSTNIELTTSNGFDLVSGAMMSAGTDLYNIFLTTAPSGTTGFSGWTSSTGVDSIIANNGTGNLVSGIGSVVAGSGNSITSNFSFVAGGASQNISGPRSFIGGGRNNTITSASSFIGGGDANLVSGIVSSVIASSGSTVSGSRSVVIGGSGISGSSNDTVYVPFLNIKSANTNNALVSILVKDTNGDVYLRDASTLSGISGNFVPMTGTGANLVTGDIQIDDAINLSWNAGNETLQYNPGTTNIELTTSNGFDLVSGSMMSAGTDLYAIFATNVSPTHVQNGLNTYTGGTATLPTVNISAATLSYLSATTISGATLYSGSTNLYNIFAPIGQGVTTASNGLTKTGNNITLGGALTANTTVSGLFTLNLGTGTGTSRLANLFGRSSGITQFLSIIPSVATATLNLTTGSTVFGLTSSLSGVAGLTTIDTDSHRSKFGIPSIQETELSLATSGATLRVFDLNNDELHFKVLYDPIAITNNGVNNSFVVSDFFQQKGIVYSGDYSSNFTPESLVTKRYVDMVATGGTSGVTGNFLPLSGGTVTGNTIFTTNVSANTLTLTTTNIVAPLNFPVFTSNPVTLNNGDAWILSATTGNALFNVRINGVTKSVELT